MHPSPSPDIFLQPALHPVYARLLCAELQRRGFGPSEIVAGTRLDFQRLHADNNWLSFEHMRRLIVRGMALSACPWLGIEVGLRTQLSSHGVLGQAVMASPTVGHALLLMQQFIGLRQRMASLDAVADEGVWVSVTELIMHPDVREYLLGYLVSNMVCFLESIAGLIRPGEITVQWPFDAPAWADAYDRLPVINSFGHQQLRTHLAPELVARPSLGADPHVLQTALRECARELQHGVQGGSLTQRILLRLAGCADSYPGLAQMAALEHVSERTLIRQLAAEGSRYQQLLDDARSERACWFLLHTDEPVERIAERLGYADTSNFSRVFRRWLDMTPREFRACGGNVSGFGAQSATRLPV